MDILDFKEFTTKTINEDISNNNISRRKITKLMFHALRRAFADGGMDPGDVYDSGVLIVTDVRDEGFIVRSVNGEDYLLTELLVHLNFERPAALELGIQVDDERPGDYSDNGIIPFDDVANFGELADFIESLSPIR